MFKRRFYLFLTVFFLGGFFFLIEISLPLFFWSGIFAYPGWIVVQFFVCLLFFICLLVAVRHVADASGVSGEQLTPEDESDSELETGNREEKLTGEVEVGAVVHELRRPLSRLRIRLREEESGELPEEFVRVQETIDRVEKVFNRDKFSPRQVSVPRLFRLLCENYETSEDLKFDLGFDWLRCDPQQIKMALDNLVRNSREAYGSSGGQVEISATRAGPEFCFSVSDEAGGMDPHQASVISGKAPDRDVEGMGLGLVLVRKICRNHRGRMLVESTPAEGTTVTLTIPRS